MNKKSFKYWLLGSAIALGLFGLIRIYYAVTDDFRLSNITYEMPYEPNFEIQAPSLSDEAKIQKILNQPYNYLGKGAQCYAFASEDGKYVIKFFKFKHLRPSLFWTSMPSIGYFKTYKEKLAARKERKLYGVFRSYKLAFDVDRAESGIIFVQLNVTGNPQRHVTLIDKIGLQRSVDLENVSFILQEKGKTLRVVLDGLLKNGDVALAKQRIGQIFDLYASEYQKGIYDHDHGVMQNTGFIDDRPIHLDVGKLVKEEKMKKSKHSKKDAILVRDKINHWIEKNYPQQSPQISEFMDQKISQLFDQTS